jgi:uncharacterized protein (TIGR02145 family)
MLNRIILLLILEFCFLKNGLSQIVKNIEIIQEAKMVVISYELISEKDCQVSLLMSSDKGKNWIGPLKQVKGDVGEYVKSGRKQIIWDVLAEFDELVGEDFVFRVDVISCVPIKIGDQYWMPQNLDVNIFRNGDTILHAKTKDEWDTAAKEGIPAWCYYENNPSKYEKYGKLYNWYAVTDERGLAPRGWHIPDDTEWGVLNNFLGAENTAGKKMKSNIGWSSNGNGTNESGFNGLPGGFRSQFGFFLINFGAYWWSVSESNFFFAGSRYLSYNNGSLSSGNYLKGSGFSVRCVKD